MGSRIGNWNDEFVLAEYVSYMNNPEVNIDANKKALYDDLHTLLAEPYTNDNSYIEAPYIITGGVLDTLLSFVRGIKYGLYAEETTVEVDVEVRAGYAEEIAIEALHRDLQEFMTGCKQFRPTFRPFQPEIPKWMQLRLFPLWDIMPKLCVKKNISPEDEIRSLMDDASAEWNNGGRHAGLLASNVEAHAIGDNVELLAIVCKAAWMFRHFPERKYKIWCTDGNEALCAVLYSWSKARMTVLTGVTSTLDKTTFVPFVCSSHEGVTSASRRVEWKDIAVPGEEELRSVFALAPSRTEAHPALPVEYISDFKRCITAALNDMPRNSRLLLCQTELRKWTVNVEPPENPDEPAEDPDDPIGVTAKSKAPKTEAAAKLKPSKKVVAFQNTLEEYGKHPHKICIVIVPGDSSDLAIPNDSALEGFLMIARPKLEEGKKIRSGVDTKRQDYENNPFRKRVLVIPQEDFARRVAAGEMQPESNVKYVDVLLPSMRSLLDGSGAPHNNLLRALRLYHDKLSSMEKTPQMRVCLMDATHKTNPWLKCMDTSVEDFDEMVKDSSAEVEKFKNHVSNTENLRAFARSVGHDEVTEDDVESITKYMKTRFRTFTGFPQDAPVNYTYLFVEDKNGQRNSTVPGLHEPSVLPAKFFYVYLMGESAHRTGSGAHSKFYYQTRQPVEKKQKQPSKTPRVAKGGTGPQDDGDAGGEGHGMTLGARLRHWYLSDHSEMLALGASSKRERPPTLKDMFMQLFYELCRIFKVKKKEGGGYIAGGDKSGVDAKHETKLSDVTLVHPLITPNTYNFTRSMLEATSGKVPCAVASYATHFVHNSSALPVLQTFVSDEDLIRHVFMEEPSNHVLIM